jgi:hypothetical protein
MDTMVVEDVTTKKAPVMDEPLKEPQRVDLVRSFEYCRKRLNVDINWKA